MKHWFQERCDRRQRLTPPQSHTSRARRLAIECCEDRRMLSGTSLLATTFPGTTLSGTTPSGTTLPESAQSDTVQTVDLAAIPAPQEGGFISVNSSGLLLTDAHEFHTFDTTADRFSSFVPSLIPHNSDLLNYADTAADYAAGDYTGGAHTGTGNTASSLISSIPRLSPTSFDADGDRYQLGIDNEAIAEGNIASNQVAQTSEIAKTISFDSPLATAAFDFTTTLQSPAFNHSYDLHLPDLDLQEPAVVSPSTDDLSFSLGDSEDQSQGGLPGLSGRGAKILVIDEPVEIVGADEQQDDREPHEGGALEIFAAVTNTQRAFETRLSAVVASNLDRDGSLPTIAAPQDRPVVAELARMVAFETVGRQRARPTATEQVTDDQSVDPAQLDPATLEPTATQVPESSVRVHGLSVPTDSERTKLDTKVSGPTATPANRQAAISVSNPTGRIDDEYDASFATAFARWPTLAAVVASYLLVERFQQPIMPTVQTPPQRLRQHRDLGRDFER